MAPLPAYTGVAGRMEREMVTDARLEEVLSEYADWWRIEEQGGGWLVISVWGTGVLEMGELDLRANREVAAGVGCALKVGSPPFFWRWKVRLRKFAGRLWRGPGRRLRFRWRFACSALRTKVSYEMPTMGEMVRKALDRERFRRHVMPPDLPNIRDVILANPVREPRANITKTTSFKPRPPQVMKDVHDGIYPSGMTGYSLPQEPVEQVEQHIKDIIKGDGEDDDDSGANRGGRK